MAVDALFFSCRWKLAVSEPLLYNIYIFKFKKSCLIFFCGNEWPWNPLEDRECWWVEVSLNYNNGLQLDWFCRKWGKLVEVTYVLLFISLWDMPDLCPKSADLGLETIAASCPLTLPLYPGLPTEQSECQATLPGGVALVSVEIQTVLIVAETILRIQNVHRSRYRTNFTLWPYLERCKVCLGTDTDSWLESLSFGVSYCFWRWMAWMWDKGKEGTQNSPPPYWKPCGSHYRATVLDVFLKDWSENTLTLNYAKLADIE